MTRAKHSFYICCRRGCPRRSLDCSTLANYLELNGWQNTGKPGRADLIIVYTCAGFRSTEERTILTIDSLLRKRKADSLFVITGCLLKINPERLEGYQDVVLLEHEDLGQLDSMLSASMPFREIPDANIIAGLGDLKGESLWSKFRLKFNLDRNSLKKSWRFLNRKLTWKECRKGVFSEKIYHLKIAHGCLGDCAFCAIRLATGRLRSKPPENVIREFEQGLSRGFSRFVLIAEDVGCYGRDRGTDVVKLLERIFAIPGDYKVILNDFNPRWLIKYYDTLKPLLQTHYRKIADLRVPIQSGSDQVLALMKRHYKVEQVHHCLKDLRDSIPGLKLHTHIIVGFPGESHEDYLLSKKLLKEIHFSSIDVNLFESRCGTPADTFTQKIPRDTIVKRGKALLR